MEGVYFLDDRSFRDPIFHDPYERPIFHRTHRCSDNGKWLEARFIRLDRCLPERGPSKYSPPSRRPWPHLSDDLLYEIVRRIACEVDRLHMSRVCRSWRVALTKIRPPAPAQPPPLPWLLLPEDGEHGLTFSCVLSGWRRTHPFFLPRAARRARYFGSYDGAWLFLAVDGQGPRGQDHVLVNLNNFEYIDLPNAIFHFDWLDPENVDIVAATLSRPPTEQGCIVAGIINSFLSLHQIAFWHMGDRVFSEAEQTVWLSPLEQVEDLLYLDENFLFLTKEEHIRVCPEPTIFHESPERILWRFQPRRRRRRDDDEEEEQVLARYLVESRGSLLMVIRLASGHRQKNLPTSAFRVFQKEVLNNGEEEEEDAFQFHEYYWSELDKLEGRMLFVGRGSSRSYEADDRYPGMEEGVYFLDDRSFAEAATGDAPKLPYHCSDNGKWSKSPSQSQGHADRCFQERGQSRSKYSPPVRSEIGCNARKFGLTHGPVKGNGPEIGPGGKVAHYGKGFALHSTGYHVSKPDIYTSLRRPWAYLSDDLLDEIVRRIPCEVDRLRMSSVCRSWRVALTKAKPPAPAQPPTLPWLLLPEPEDGEHGLTFSCILSGWRRTHPFFLPHAACRARYFGSYDGVWLFLAIDGLQGEQAQDHVLVNLNNFQYLDLPNAIRKAQDLEKLAIVAATVSCLPTEQGCIVAGIIELPLAPLPPSRVLAHGRLRCLTGFCGGVATGGSGGSPILQGKGRRWNFPSAHPRGKHLCVCASSRGAIGQPVLARYLVESRREILMVVRFGSALQHEREESSEFRVFEHKKGKFGVNLWNSMSELDGRMLFIVRGAEEGAYFLDDRSFHDPIFPDPIMGFDGDAPKEPYRCSDNGKCSRPPSQVERCFPERGQSRSKYSPPPRRRWAAADEDVLYEVVLRIPCEIDRRNMSRVCNSWRVALAKLKTLAPPPPLPWLALPESDDGLPTTVSCVLSGCRTHAFSVLQDAHRAPRYFGSYDGGWLFLAVGGQAQRQALLNIKINGVQTLDLPNLARVNEVYPGEVNPNRDREMAIVAATLSCQPTEQGCIVAGIIESSPYLVPDGHVVRSIAFWRMGDQVVLPVIWALWALEEENPLMRLEEAEDLLFHNGAFHFLTRVEDVLACEEPPVFYRDAVSLVPVNMFFLPRVHDENETVLARYLVESGKKLLMVVRLASGRGQRTTSAFRVFQKKKFDTGEEDEPSQNRSVHFEYYWSELDELDGRMLFVGRGCSRSYEAGDRYPGMEEGVYFLDDPSIHHMIIGDAPKLPYLCSDNGKWSKSPTDPQGQVERCFPERGPSIHSPPSRRSWAAALDDVLYEVAPPHPVRDRSPPHESRLPLLARGAREGQAPGRRYFGSYDGAWVFLADDGQGNQTQEYPRRVAQDPCPRQPLIPSTSPSGSASKQFYPALQHWDCKRAIVAATLFCKPTEQGSIVAGFLEYFPTTVMGRGMIREADWFRHVLPRISRGTRPGMFFQPRVHDENDTVLACYVVESGENLLMVLRLTSGRQHLPTSVFRVFQKKKFNNGEEDEPLNNGVFQFQYYWSELDKLEGRMLSYEAGDRYPGMEEDVYFLDDRSFREPIMAFDDDADELPYRCSVNGKWSKSPTPQLDRCFPARDPLIDSPPMICNKWVDVHSSY
uniref:F-box domain-containing protein n=1 Tax=Oryza punctata TaxID=4537 RepID=A0A0E0L531_ORYPU